MKDKKLLVCSFCGRPKDDVRLLVSGMTGHICESCAEQVMEIVEDDVEFKKKDALTTALTIHKPKALNKALDAYVIGQENAKKVLSVAVYNHFKRLNQEVSNDDVEIEKSNVIMVGRTGTGKTLLAKTIATILNVPFAIADATVLTEAGYVGEDVESILARLLQAADYDPILAGKGIIFIDEIDKIARKGDNASLTRDVSGEGVQQGLLKLLEGTVIGVPPYGGRKHPEQKLIEVNTKNILFICGGAFDGIETQISRRINKQPIGFTNGKDEKIDEDNLLQYVTPSDLRSFGLIPELIGRFPVLTYLNPLDKTAMINILTVPKNSLMKQYTKLFKMDGVKLEVTDEVLHYIVDLADDFKLGARGLRAICEAIMLDAMYDAPSERKTQKQKELVIDLAYATKHFEKSGMSKLKVA